MKVLTPRGNVLVTTVAELINPVDGRWDVNLIQSIFWPVDVHRILQIPIGHGHEDMVAWHHNRNGIFSVRSAYHTQWKYKFDHNAVEGGTGPSSVWRQLWKLSIPSKIKIFAWKALHGCLQCFVTLANKHIPINGVNCPRCLSEAEDIKHALFSCNRAKEIWISLEMWDKIEKLLLVDRSGSMMIQEII